MKKIKADDKGFIISIISIAVVVGLAMSAIYSLKAPDKEKIEKYFKRDNADLVLITEYFMDSGYLEMYIGKEELEDDIMSAGLNIRGMKIENEAVIKAINRLLKRRGYTVIGRYGNTVYFENGGMLARDRGIAYSISEEEPMSRNPIKSEPLSESGWYYYEDDYN